MRVWIVRRRRWIIEGGFFAFDIHGLSKLYMRWWHGMAWWDGAGGGVQVMVVLSAASGRDGCWAFYI